MKNLDLNPHSAFISETQEIKIFRQGNWYKSLDSVLIPNTCYYLHLASSLMLLDDAKKIISQRYVFNQEMLQRVRLLEEAMALFTTGHVFIEGFGK